MSELQFHPLADLVPTMTGGEQLYDLVADIRKHGLRHPIVLYEGKILDGRHRYTACLTAEVKPRTVDGDKYLGIENHADAVAYVISANIHRRHLTPEQKRDLIAKLIQAQPEKSDRQIGEMIKADHKTVGAVRAQKEATGEISPVEKRVGKDGRARKQPAKKKTSEKARKEARLQQQNDRARLLMNLRYGGKDRATGIELSGTGLW